MHALKIESVILLLRQTLAAESSGAAAWPTIQHHDQDGRERKARAAGLANRDARVRRVIRAGPAPKVRAASPVRKARPASRVSAATRTARQSRS